MNNYLLYIEWGDAHGRTYASQWKSLDELDNQGKSLIVRSIGWVIAETKDAVTLCPNLSGELNDNMIVCGNNEMTIPKSAIRKRVKLVNGKAGAG